MDSSLQWKYLVQTTLNFYIVSTYSCDKKDMDPYNKSFMEMGSLWQGKTYLLNAASLLVRQYVNRAGLYVSKVELWVSVGQRA